jgi:hypothetical protein
MDLRAPVCGFVNPRKVSSVVAARYAQLSRLIHLN